MEKTKEIREMTFPVEVKETYVTENSTVLDADGCLFFFERNDQLEQYLKECGKVCDMLEVALIASWYKKLDRRNVNPAIMRKLEEEAEEIIA